MVQGLSGRDLLAANKAIDHAVSLVGQVDYLLDTRGIVRFASGDLPEPKRLPTGVIRTCPSGSLFPFGASFSSSESYRRVPRGDEEGSRIDQVG